MGGIYSLLLFLNIFQYCFFSGVYFKTTMRAWRHTLTEHRHNIPQRRQFNHTLRYLRAGARLQCMCMTSKGEQCKNKAKAGTIYCGRHRACPRPMQQGLVIQPIQTNGGAECSKYKKTKDPKCEEQAGCMWGKNDKGRGACLSKSSMPTPPQSPSHQALSDKAFRKMQVMGYKELRPREIEKSPSLLDKYVGWYASEKIDGWQAVWDGEGTLYTKTYKRKFAVPKEWLALLPRVPLVGEIKIKGHQATKTASLLKDDPLWKRAYFHVFDVVGKSVDLPFSKRVRIVQDTVRDACKRHKDCPLVAVPQIIMKSRQDIMAFYKKVLRENGEGLVITAPTSKYDSSSRRSKERVKLKGRNDAEAKVTRYNMRDGKLKSLTVDFHGTSFHLGIGLTHAHRSNPKKYFPIGTMVTFSYRELGENGKPKEARFVRVRKDI